MQRVRDILASKDGISIVFAVLLVVVLLVLGGIMVSYGYAGYNRAVSDNASERNYQNVASATKFVREEFESEKEKQRAAIAAAGNDAAAAAAVSASGWGVDMLNPLLESNEGATGSHKLQAAADNSDAQFSEVTVTVRKAGGSSYDVICYETDNPNGTALQFSVAYAEVKTLVNGKEIKAKRLTDSANNPSTITKVGQ